MAHKPPADGSGETVPAYPLARQSRSEILEVNGVRYTIRRWGNPDGPPLLMLHGARDCSITFQFVADAFTRDWNIAAPDWRGHGHSAWIARQYWVHDFLGDLDTIVEAMFPGEVPDLVGHSLGGNVGGLYVGLRPTRIRRFVALDAMGPAGYRFPVDMAATLDSWLGRGGCRERPGYDTLEEVTRRLVKANARLTAPRAAFLAEHSTRLHADGKRHWLFDPAMTHSLPTLHTIEEWGAIWSRVTIPVRLIGSSDVRRDAPSFSRETAEARLKLHPTARYTCLENTGHNLHHDRPADVAAMIEDFLNGDDQ